MQSSSGALRRGASRQRDWKTRQIDCYNETPQNADVLRDVLSTVLAFPGPASAIAGQEIIIRNLPGGVELEGGAANSADVEEVNQLIIRAHRNLKPIRAVFWWQEGLWLHYRALLYPWTRETRREVFGTNASLRDELGGANVYFEVDSFAGAEPRPAHARLLLAKEATR